MKTSQNNWKTPIKLMMPVNANIWRNLITKMFILEVFGSVSINLKNKKKRKTNTGL
jgi:hypothetical protein